MSTWRRDRTRLAGSRPRWYGGAPKGLKLKEWQEAPVAGPRSPGWLAGKCAQEHSFSLSVPGHWHETSDRFKTLASPYPLCTEPSPPPHPGSVASLSPTPSGNIRWLPFSFEPRFPLSFLQRDSPVPHTAQPMGSSPTQLPVRPLLFRLYPSGRTAADWATGPR